MNSEQTSGAVLINQQTGQAFPLGRELVTIGRKSDNTIVLADDLKVSRHHATIEWKDGAYTISDVGSANGTFLNNTRITTPRPLGNGDMIDVGSTTFVVSLAQDQTKPRMPALPEQDETMVSPPTAAPAEAESAAPENPYVGPRTFTQQESDRFFGREREARELLSLVISERLVLFYAQSGAGKSSLINARLVPQLRESDFAVLPIARVSGELPQGISNVENIFVFNLLLSLDESDGDPSRFTNMSLTNFLTRLTSLDGRHYYYDEKAVAETGDENFDVPPYVLIIDQFEEIFTTHPARWQDREDFFRQLEEAMTNDPLLWVVLSLREDYVAAMDAFPQLLPGKMRARFYMQRMGHEAALDAVKNPARQYERPFAPGVAEKLVDDLRQIKVHGVQVPAQTETQLGQFVEPVQLQVVCYQLWENLKDTPVGQITQQDLQELGDVDEALAKFYEQAIAEVVDQTGVPETELRYWFENELITEAETRGTVYRGKNKTAGISNRAVDLLVARFLLRSEVRTGGTWYELVHDRFIEPILQANRTWREKQPLIRVAQNWQEAGKPESGLLEGQPLKEALAGNWRALGPLVQEFLEASQNAQKAKEEAQRQRDLEQAQQLADERQRRVEEEQKRVREQQEYVEELDRKNASLRKRAWVITAVGVVAVLLAFLAGLFGWQAGALATRAATAAAEEADARQTAIAERNAAATNEAQASEAQSTAEAGKATAEAERAAAEANAAEARKVLDQQGELQTAVATATAAEANAQATRVAAAQATINSANATLTAVAITPTPVPPTYTPIPSGRTPSPSAPTDTPTATSTATPDPQIAALETERANSHATQTAVAQSNATATAEATRRPCEVEPDLQFSRIWDKYQQQLGCPAQQAVGGSYAEQQFENGYMMWSGVREWFFVMVEDSKAWYFYDQAAVERFNPKEDGPACEPASPSPDDRYQPIRGFGAIWCNANEDIQEQVGWATEKEFAVVDNLVQKFKGGFLLQSSRNVVYVLFGEDGGKYEKVELE